MFFTKYLPVEGELRIGQHYFDKESNIHLFQDSLPAYHYYNAKVAQLFLCSRDIQVGDTVHYDGGLVHYDSDDDLTWLVEKVFERSVRSGCSEIDKRTVYKIIGSISPKADWVKEGDEIEEWEWGWDDAFGYITIKSPVDNKFY